MFSMRFTGGNEQISIVEARIKEINDQKYELKLPVQPDNIDEIADWVEWKGRRIGIGRRSAYGPIDEEWIYRLSTVHIMYWAMSKNSDVFVDLLEAREKKQHGPRRCLRGVTSIHIKARKELIGWVLGEYVKYLTGEAQKTKRGPAC